MEIILDNKKIAALVIVFLVLISVIAVLAYPSSQSSPTPTAGKSVEDDLDNMTWYDILKEARGQTVTLGILNDVQILKWVDEVLIPEAEAYGITVEYGTLAGYAAITADRGLEDPIYDMYWMSTGMYGFSSFTDSWWSEDWKSVLPNVVYLSDNTDELISHYISDADGYVGNALEFSGAELSMAYNSICSSPDLTYNVAKLTSGTESKYVRVATSNSGTLSWEALATTEGDALSSGIAVDMDTLVSFLENNADVSPTYGLPNDYIELLAWAEIYPGQFTYPSPAGKAYYVGYSVVDAIAYELRSDGSGGWELAPDRDANVAYVDSLDATDIENGALDYVEAYLAELDKYVHKDANGNSYYLTDVPYPVTSLNEMIVGQEEDYIIGDNTVLLGMTTLTSITARQTGTYAGLCLYSMDTSLIDQYCWAIGKYSDAKAACMVVANLCTDPYIQGQLYSITGNKANIDLEHYLSLLGAVKSSSSTFVDGGDYYINEFGTVVLNPDSTNAYLVQYVKAFGFLEEWANDETKTGQYITPVRLAEAGVVGNLVKYQSAVNDLWTSATS